MALKLTRKMGQVVNVTITHEKLEELARKGKPVTFYLRPYRFNVNTGEVDIAFVDDDRNFEFARDDWGATPLKEKEEV